MNSHSNTGTLWLVVGPSGAGKDSLLDGAKAALSESSAHYFVRRDITRPADAGGEDHNPVTVEEFEAKQEEGGYCLSWDAHNLRYGIPKSIEEELAAGRHVIVNVSRALIGTAREMYPDVRVVNITVPRAELESRLRGRGRESEADIQKRLERAEAFTLEGPGVITFINDRPLEESISAFTALFA
ncbi:phosphonate metabolism protein/1,5-bisphosphokinase (PRPP-forming) PhnN [Nisaea denitrificans]|uniref:phosphonate metabolism protein/1,5-bisphosphokinase (PRPP-forming) PhnN n=1 Tax=Nisaea denitrificans TaxID=390877 RepID=UPI00040462C6|nr:phosphonate metabolism protein/1,5-bisphosphokinase (PRPP-forming) PhnN [Nisaea denitrificans]